ncbi:hypothetical protein Tco_0798649 [Tanacetum coccineum]
MDITRAQQKALDDDLVAPANRLKIGKCNLRLSSNLNSKEPTLQVVTASRHHSSLRFKMNDKSYTVNVDNFRDMLQIFPKLPSQKFEDPTFEEEILSFIRDLGHTGEIKGMYHNKNVDYVYLLWEDLVYQVENKNFKKNNDMCYPRFTKVIVDYFMEKDQSLPRRNKMFWHTVRDDHMFTTIRVISKHQDTQIYGVILPQHLTNQAMLESEAYKTYHAYATGEKIPKPKYVKNKADPESSPKKKFAQASKGKRLKTLTKVAKPVKKKQTTTTSKEKGLNVLSEVAFGSGANEGTGVIRGVPDVPTYNSDDEHISWKSSDEDNDDETKSNNDDDDFVHPKLSTFDENERQDEEDKEEEWLDDEAYDEETQGVNVEGEELDEEGTNEEDDVNELYRDVNVNLEGRDTKMIDAPQTNVQGTQVIEDTHVIITAATPEVPQQSSSVSSGFISNMLIHNPDTVSSIPGIVDTYLANKINEVVKTVVQLQSDKLRTEAQAYNEYFINKIDENMKKIIKEQVKIQVKEQVSKILPKIKKFINDHLEAEVLTRSSNEAKTSHINSAEDSLQSIDDEDEDEEPSVGSKRGSKRRRAGKEPESTSAPKEKTSISTGKSKEGSKSHQKSTCKSAQAEEPIQVVEDLKEPAHQEFDTGFTEDQPVNETTQHHDCLVELEYFLEEVCKATTDQLDWNNPEGQLYPDDLRKPLPLIPNSRGHRVIPFDHFINNDLAYLSGGESSRTYATSVIKIKAADYGHIKWIEDFIPNLMWSKVPIFLRQTCTMGHLSWG